MKATKLFLMIACGIGAINANAELNQQPSQIKSPEVLIVNIWINGVDYHTETVAFSENGKRFVECEALSDIGIRVEKISRHLTKKDFC